jgi:hypothetical protein
MFAKKKYDRFGVLFEGKYKNILVDSERQLLQLTKYIHLNPKEIIGSKPLTKYEFSSYPCYVGVVNRPKWLNNNEILKFFALSNPSLSYRKFVEEISFNPDLINNVSMD